MNYTYKWQLQPQIAWKGPSTNSVVPSWSRPFNNGANPGENPNPHFASNAGYQSSPLPESGKEKNFCNRIFAHTYCSEYGNFFCFIFN